MKPLTEYVRSLDERICETAEVAFGEDGAVYGADFNGVYFAFRGRKLLYIGATWNVGRRIQGHVSAIRGGRTGWHKRVRPRVAAKSLTWIAAKIKGCHTEDLRVEAALIGRLAPAGNAVIPKMPDPPPPDQSDDVDWSREPRPRGQRWVTEHIERDDPILQLYERE